MATDIHTLCNVPTDFNPVFIVTGDFNSFRTDFLEIDFGLSQLVTVPIYGNNIVDEFFTSRPDLFQGYVFRSLIKTEHRAVHFWQSSNINGRVPAGNCNDRKRLLNDFRANNIDLMCCALGCHDWGVYMNWLDIQIIYDNFVHVIQTYIKQCIPVKTVRLGRRDPDYITPLIKSMPNKRSKLMRTGKKEAAEILASDINRRIAGVLHHRLDKLADSGVKDMWNAIKAKNGTTSNKANSLISNVDSTDKLFANISFDQHYNVQAVTAFRQEPGDLNDYIPLNAYEVEPMLRRITKTATGSDNIPYWVFCNCSFELADVVTHIFNCSLGAGVLPVQWLSAVLTPVPKVANPATLAGFRPISVTPILSRVVEKCVVT